jgi:hypothetical protein
VTGGGGDGWGECGGEGKVNIHPSKTHHKTVVCFSMVGVVGELEDAYDEVVPEVFKAHAKGEQLGIYLMQVHIHHVKPVVKEFIWEGAGKCSFRRLSGRFLVEDGSMLYLCAEGQGSTPSCGNVADGVPSCNEILAKIITGILKRKNTL